MQLTISRPIVEVQKIFDSVGITSVTQSTPDGPTVVGYYACDKPPTVGLGIGDGVFNIPSSSFSIADNGNNNCTSVLGGFDTAALPGLWVFGQREF
jgi:hypothetical protein